MSDHVPEFQGRVVRFPPASLARAANIAGRYEVWVPGSKADAAAAVAHTQKRTRIARSGFQGAAVSDVVHAPGGVVVYLAHLSKIARREGKVKVQAGAIRDDLAALLAKYGAGKCQKCNHHAAFQPFCGMSSERANPSFSRWMHRQIRPE